MANIFGNPLQNRRSEPNIGMLGLFGIHALYSYSTYNNEEIKVSDKYQMVNYGTTQFMIIDDKGRHFNVNNSLWYWKWDNVEEWGKIQKGDTIKVGYYGIRSPFFGLFPNIISSSSS